MLKKHEVKVWVFRDKEIPQHREELEKVQSLLHPEEAFRLSKRLYPQKKDRSLVGRYMIWRTVAAHLGVDWTTFKGEEGIHTRNLVYQNIHWSITHTEGLTMVAFALDQKVGVDTEALSTHRDVLKIAERYFEEEERALLFSSSPYQAEENFFRLWTTKEAHYKYISFGNFYSFLRRSCLYLQEEKDVWGLKWEKDFFFTVVTDKHPESNLEVKPFSEKLFL